MTDRINGSWGVQADAPNPDPSHVYHKAFVRHAKADLPGFMFKKVERKARATSGGLARAASVTKSQPPSSDLHVDVPLAGKRRRKRASGPPPPGVVVTILKGAFALVTPDAIAEASMGAAHARDVEDAVTRHRLRKPRPVRVVAARVVKSAKIAMPIIDVAKHKRVVYCVGLEPGTPDAHDDVMTPEEVEYTAHRFLVNKAVIGSMHEKAIRARPVESYIAPMDLAFDAGAYGRQVVKKGSWVLGIKVEDPGEWAKVLSGAYTGISVGGFGLRRDLGED